MARLLAGEPPAPVPSPPAPTLSSELDDAVSWVQSVPIAQSAPGDTPAGQVAAQQPAAPPPDPRVIAQWRLREAVFAPFRGVQGRFGIAVKDLGSGYSVLLNQSFPFQSASLYKLPVMYEVFKQREWGLFNFREELTIGPEDAAMDLGTLFWPIGTRITIGTALERMVTISDNSSAWMLTRRVGTSTQINESMVNLDLDHTYIRGDDLQTSAADMLRMLEMLARGHALDPATSAEMVHLMVRQQVRNRIPVLLPPEATVANKTGNWEAAAHDVAIVYGTRATFVCVFLTDGVADFDAVYYAMAHAARNVYDVLHDPSFETQPSPPLPALAYSSYAAAPRLPGNAVVGTRASLPTTTVPSQPTPRGQTLATPAPAQSAPSVPRDLSSNPATAPPAVSIPAAPPRPTVPVAKPTIESGPAIAPASKPTAPAIFVPPKPNGQTAAPGALPAIPAVPPATAKPQ